MYSFQEEQSFLHLKFHFFLFLLKLHRSAFLYSFLSAPIELLAHPLPRDLTWPGGGLGTCFQSALPTTTPEEQAHLGRTHPSPSVQLAPTLTTANTLWMRIITSTQFLSNQPIPLLNQRQTHTFLPTWLPGHCHPTQLRKEMQIVFLGNEHIETS